MQNQSLSCAHELIQSIEEGIVVIDSDKRITFFNPSAEQITGWSANEVVGKSVNKIFPMNVGDKIFPEFAGNFSHPTACQDFPS